LTNGGLMVVQANDQGSQVIRRLRPDGTTDASFAWPFNDAVTIHPLVTFPDGSLLVNIYGDPSLLAGLLKVTSNGALDPTWQSQLPPAALEIGKVVCQSDGRLVVLHGSPFHGGVRLHRLSRFNPDGSLDSTFDGSVVSPNPVPTVRVRVSGLVLGRLYSLEERNGLESTAILTGELQFLLEPNQRQPVELVDRLVSADVRRFWTLRPVSHHE